MVVRLLAILLLTGCAARGPWAEGLASWYGPGFAGKPTASGVIFRPSKRTTAHRTLPFGTVLKVVRLSDGRRVRTVVNDRGPFAESRVLDLSKGSARKLRMLDDGVVGVKYRVVGCKTSYSGSRSCNP